MRSVINANDNEKHSLQSRLRSVINANANDNEKHSQQGGVGAGVPPGGRVRFIATQTNYTRRHLTAPSDKIICDIMTVPSRNQPLHLDVEIDYSTMGPAMRELSGKQRAFVYAFVACGGNSTDAARAAGYGSKSDGEMAKTQAATSAGFNNLRNEKVLEAMKEEALRRLRSGAMLAAERLLQLAVRADLSNRDAIKIADILLDRAGLVVAQKMEIEHKTEREQEIVAQITQLAKGLGLDPSRLLGQNVKVVDADFEVVEPGRTGLEDIL